MREYDENKHFSNFKSIKNNNNIKFLQRNCMKFIDAMLSCLRYIVINKYDIVLLQEP